MSNITFLKRDVIFDWLSHNGPCLASFFLVIYLATLLKVCPSKILVYATLCIDPL